MNRLGRRRRGGAAPPPGRGPRFWRQLDPRWRLGVRIAAAVIALGCLLLGATVAYAALTLPNVNDIGKATGTVKIYDVKHRLIAEIGHDNQSRSNVPIDRVATVMQQAQVAAEDRGFYDEGAFNFKRIAKALLVDTIARRPSQGASTITQQLAKLAFYGANADKSPLRKLREALLANELDQKYSKPQILNMYLNLVYYGHGAYGIQDAAQTYFGKDAGALDVREASLLAGLPQAPSFYDPFQNPQAAFARQHYVLSGLVETGKVSQQDADAVDPLVGGSSPSPAQVQAQQQNQQAIIDDLKNGKQTAQGPAPHFVEWVREQLHDRFADDPNVTAGSLEVTTTLDLDLQQQAGDAVRKGVAAIGHGANNGALLMIDSHSGNIMAMVGSADFGNQDIGGEYNITTAYRRPGSSFKPYVYTEGFRLHKLRPDTVLDDTRDESNKLAGVKDFDRAFLGKMTAANALVLSRNVPAEEAGAITGMDNVIGFAGSLGIDASRLQNNVSTAIGSSDVRMIDHASAYAAFSNGGHKVSARGILKVVDQNGNTLVDDTQPSQGDQVMTKGEADTTTKILTRYAAQWHLPFNRLTAGKSGTTDDFVDAWYMTYTPDFVVATWTGRTQGGNSAELTMDTVFGTTGPGLHIAVPFVNGLRLPVHPFTLNPDLGDCSANGGSPLPSGSPVPSGCPTPSPTPTPSPSPTPSATATQTPVTTLPTPSLFLPTPTPRPTQSATPQPSASPSPGGGGGGGQPAATASPSP